MTDPLYDKDDYTASQNLAADLRDRGTNGLVYTSVRFPEGPAVALFWPDVAGIPVQGRHFCCYWDGRMVSRVKNPASGEVFNVIEES